MAAIPGGAQYPERDQCSWEVFILSPRTHSYLQDPWNENFNVIIDRKVPGSLARSYFFLLQNWITKLKKFGMVWKKGFYVYEAGLELFSTSSYFKIQDTLII